MVTYRGNQQTNIVLTTVKYYHHGHQHSEIESYILYLNIQPFFGDYLS